MGHRACRHGRMRQKVDLVRTGEFLSRSSILLWSSIAPIIAWDGPVRQMYVQCFPNVQPALVRSVG